MTTNKPNKTEYKGRVYDSKSEAIFARWLDLIAASISQKTPVAFRHGPTLTVADHTWDFCVDQFGGYAEPSPKKSTPIGIRTFIEYKPRMPTTTYIQELRRCVQRYEKEFGDLADAQVRVQFIIVHGDPYKFRVNNKHPYHFEPLRYWMSSSQRKDYGTEYFDSRFEPEHMGLLPEATSYRFDLPQPEEDKTRLEKGSKYVTSQDIYDFWASN